MKYFQVFLLALMFSIETHAQTNSINNTNSIVLLKNENNLVPFKNLDSLSIYYSGNSKLKNLGDRYTENQGINKMLITSNLLVTDSYHSKVLLLLADSLMPTSGDLENFQAIVYSPKSDSASLDLAIQKLFGGRGFTDVLADSIYDYQPGTGIQTQGKLRLSFGQPKEVGLDSTYLFKKIDSIAIHAIDSGVAPGIQVLVARNGMVVMHKTYGFLTYDSLVQVQKEMLYDFASITKITGALPGLMCLHDENKFSIDATMGTYLPYFDRGNKKELVYRRVLSHNAGLKPWIPYWQTTLKKNGKFKRRTLSKDSSDRFPDRMTPDLYLYENYRDNIYKQILKSTVNKNQGYKYSGLSFYLYPDIVERLSGMEYEAYLKQTFYKPLGASTITYNPLRFYPVNKIVPTEIDTFFRMIPIRGTVHDEGAAMMKGISSNAGLFGTTLDLAKLMQMYLWEGSFGGKRFISENTIEKFTFCHYCNEGNRRGLGFDKPVLGDKSTGSTAVDASMHSFGHSGYTGTFAWADPENGVLFIFMSNRVYPTRTNTKLYQFNVRPTMHQVIYDAIKRFKTAR